jgi:hypothetical protein
VLRFVAQPERALLQVLNGMISAQHADRVYHHATATRGHRALHAGRPRQSCLRVKSSAALSEQRVTQWLVTDLTSGWLPNTFAFVPQVYFDKVRCGLLLALLLAAANTGQLLFADRPALATQVQH